MALNNLFSPLELGSLTIPNRMIMAPLTRARASTAHVPSALMATYYAQRADCGLIISEATAVDRLGMGWHRAPGIWNDAMVAAWAPVTAAVHAAGGRIYCQLWHMGRLVLPDYLDGELPIAPSAIAGEGHTFAPPSPDHTSLFLPTKPYVTPREMTVDDIDGAIASYAIGAANALAAGFDGIEIHAANGYLIDQFLQSKTNRRSDVYGGSGDNRARFLREVVKAVIGVVDARRVGLRVSPTSTRKGMGDESPGALAGVIGTIARDARLAYVHLIEPIADGFMEKPEHGVIQHLRSHFGGIVIQNGSFNAYTADHYIATGQADAISFGRPYIANPDLVHRFKHALPLATPNFDYAYVGDATGYTDYPKAGAGR